MEESNYISFSDLLEESVKSHGHLCPGQVLGVRMAVLGLRSVGITDPRGQDRKSLLVFVEMDRCAADAIQSVTGCSLGKRTMKFFDYGKMAATFTNLKTNRSVRVVAKVEARENAKSHVPGSLDKYAAQVSAYKAMSDDDLFRLKPVRVALKSCDMPGRPLARVTCELCGEEVQDLREVRSGGRIFCIPCALGGYYQDESPLAVPTVGRESHNGMQIRSKIWIEVDHEPVFGRGRMFLLKAIDKYGSVNQAAKDINISYRKALSYIKAMEERLGMKLVDRSAGGKNGGGALITARAKELLGRYELLEKGVREQVDEKFRNIFFDTIFSGRGGNHVRQW